MTYLIVSNYIDLFAVSRAASLLKLIVATLQKLTLAALHPQECTYLADVIMCCTRTLCELHNYSLPVYDYEEIQ